MEKPQLRLSNVVDPLESTVKDYEKQVDEKQAQKQQAIDEFAHNHSWFKVGERIKFTKPEEKEVTVRTIDVIYNDSFGHLDIRYQFDDDSTLFQTDLEKDEYEWEPVGL